MINKKRVAIILLAFADFEAIEISLANISKTLVDDMDLYVLQNGRGTYDCERTLQVARRYQRLFPKNIFVVDWISPGIAYYSIKSLINSECMKKYDYICKIDDDVFPLRNDWFDKIIDCYSDSKSKFGNNLGYVTGLVNNNPWGFKQTVEICGLKQEYDEKIGREHYAGFIHDSIEPERLMKKNEIYDGCCGTIWSNPYISRWLHEKTSLKPDEFILKTEGLGYKQVDNKKRYSINVVMFEKNFWNIIDMNSPDDEHMFREYCRLNNKKIVADLSNPFVHLNFYTQRDENKDLMPKFREVYEKWLKLPYPVSLCPNKDYENENRLRYIENKIK